MPPKEAQQRTENLLGGGEDSILYEWFCVGAGGTAELLIS